MRKKQIFDYTIIGSGSSGNAVRISNIMFDCGMPFKDMKEELYKCDTLLITHSHKDHIKPQTLSKIMSEFPRIKVYANSDVAYKYRVNKVIGTTPFEVGNGILVTPWEGNHDVPVTFFTLNIQGKDIIYATDTNSLEVDKKMKFDYLFLESNYDEYRLREISPLYKTKGYDPAISNLRHLSTQQCKAFYFIHRKKKDSELIELHKSSRFY